MLKEKIKPKPKFMSITQFTEYLGDNVISKQHVYKMIKKKENHVKAYAPWGAKVYT